MMDYLSSEYIEQQRQWLLARRESIRELSINHPIDTSMDARGRQAQIDIALKRIAERQYGLCMPCGLIIERQLLDSCPEQILCSSCMKEAADRADIRHG